MQQTHLRRRRSPVHPCFHCLSACPFSGSHPRPLLSRTFNGRKHLCDGSGDRFFATGEDPEPEYTLRTAKA